MEVTPVDAPKIIAGESAINILPKLNRSLVVDLRMTVINQFFLRNFPDRYSNGTPDDEAIFRSIELQRLAIKDPLHDGIRVVALPITRKILIFPSEEIYRPVLYDSNRGLIPPEFQERLKNVSVGVAGLSVGGEILIKLAQLGVGKLTGIDDDILSVGNLNRLSLPTYFIGSPKALAMYEYLLGLNPFGEFDFIRARVSSSTIERFLSSNPKYIVDAVDDPDVKELLRQKAKEKHSILIMATDLGKGVVLLDIEDYLHRKRLEPFNGRSGRFGIPWEEMNRMQKIAAIVGLSEVPFDMLRTLKLLREGKIASFPQLGMTVSLSAAVVTWAVLQLEEGHALPKRMRIDFLKEASVVHYYIERIKSYLVSVYLQRKLKVGK